jgi:hypothetical protein
MTRSFRDPHFRVPNFGIEDALLQRWPEWVNRKWRMVPPASPPWSPPPSLAQDGTDPLGDPPGAPAPLQPRSDDGRHRVGSDLIDWLLGAYHAQRGRSKGRLPSSGAGAATPEPFIDARPWRPVEPLPDLMQPLPFDQNQAERLKRIRPEELLIRSGPPKVRAVQPPIFFPFD